jgi:hypothetical protein
MVQKRTLQGKSIRDLASRRPSDGQLLNKGKEKTNTWQIISALIVNHTHSRAHEGVVSTLNLLEP